MERRISFNRTFGFLLLGIGLIAGTVAACGGEPRQPDSARDSPTTLTELIWGDERLMGPYTPLPRQFLIFLPLFDEEVPDSPYTLSESWEMSEDGRTWTFHLRPDARWQDGVPVTAHDVVFTFELMGSPAVARRDPAAARAEAVDDRTVVLHLNRPGVWPIQVVYPKHLLEDLDPSEFQDWEFWTRPVGNGPYRYDRFIPGTMVELLLDPDWSGPRLPIERYRLRFQGEPFILFRSAEVDVAGGFADAVRALADDPAIQVQYAYFNGHWSLRWNHTRPPLDDRRVRRALTLALDRREFARIARLPDTIPLSDVLVTRRQWKTRAFPAAMPHDPAQARRLLAEAGWADVDGNGIIEKGGRELSLEVIAREDAHAEAVLVQAQLSRIGVDVEIATMEFFSWENRLKRGTADAVLGPMNPDLVSIGSGLLDPVQTGYQSPQLAELVAALDTAFTPSREDRIYEASWEIFRRDVPVTLLRPSILSALVHERAAELWNRHVRQLYGGPAEETGGDG